MEKKTRTITQNKALHAYFALVAVALNDAGYDVEAVIKQQMEIPWSPTMVKELIWKMAQKVHLNKPSTTELETKEIDKIYDIVNRYLGEKFGIHIAFPSQESLIDYED